MSDELFRADAETAQEFQQLMADPAARQAFTEAKARAAKTGARVRYSHVLQVVAETPWAIRPPMLAVIVDLLAFRIAGGRLSPEEITARVDAARLSRPAPETAPRAEAVAVIPVDGVIVPRASAFEEMSGGTSLESIKANFRAAMRDESIKAVVLDINSPGGMVPGIPEMAAEIRGARGTKPIYAVADHQASSGGYWLGSQADKFYVTKSGRVGSVGVLSIHENREGEAAKEGVQHTLISAGEFKTEGNPYEPLSDEARADVQEQVNAFYGMFVADVAKGRGVDTKEVLDNYGQGRELLAKPALKAGMVDGIAGLETVVKGLLDSPRASTFAFAVTEPTALAENTAQPGVALPDIPSEAYADDATDLDPPEMTVEVTGEGNVVVAAAAVDNSAWDGNKAMGQCSTAAEYRSICAGEHSAGTPDERQHWALPHHYLGKGPNAQGVRSALGRIGQTQDLTNRGAAQRHLDAHQSSIDSGAAAGADEPDIGEQPSIENEDEQRSRWEAVLDRVDAYAQDT
jgi:signal peptide peptidase SppA